MQKKLLTLLLSSCIYFLFFSKVSADFVMPEFFTKHCNQFELEVQCSYNSDSTSLNCIGYRQNPNFRFLTAKGHLSVSNGEAESSGIEKYCFKLTSPQALIQYVVFDIFPSIMITLPIEISLFVLFISKKQKPIISVTALNIISVTALHLILASISTTNIPLILILEVGVVLFEIWGIRAFAKIGTLKRITLFVIVANISSSIGGLILVDLLSQFR